MLKVLFGEFREEDSLWELKHLSTGRKRKKILMPLVAASEKGLGQTESLSKESKRCGEDK